MNDKRIYVGYFGRIKDYQQQGLVPVSIARFRPRWIPHLLSAVFLAPSAALLKDCKAGNVDREQFTARYRRELDQSVKPQELIGLLPDNAVLLCYEKAMEPSDWCHRHIFAEWFREHTGIEVKEATGLTKVPEPEPDAPPQPATEAPARGTVQRRENLPKKVRVRIRGKQATRTLGPLSNKKSG